MQDQMYADILERLRAAREGNIASLGALKQFCHGEIAYLPDASIQPLIDHGLITYDDTGVDISAEVRTMVTCVVLGEDVTISPLA